MKPIEMKSELRDATGKSAVRALRKGGRLPAVLYGEGKPPLPLSLDKRFVQRTIAAEGGEHTVVSLSFENSSEPPQLAMFKEIQHATISRELLHADLLRISLDKKVEVGISVEFINSESVKKKGGIVQQNMSEITIECFP
ncbi:MAG: 50S ribosomal protein L25, partial [bacterium]